VVNFIQPKIIKRKMLGLNCKGRLLVIREALVMGIINTTPDSFFKGSRAPSDAVLRRAEKMISEGADILDLGGQSTRPGSTVVTEAEERERVIPAVVAVCKRFPEMPVSIDTFYASVAREAINEGAAIINDISAGSIDPGMFEAVASLRVPYVLTHMKGFPATMQQQPYYENVTTEVFDSLLRNLAQLRELGVNDVILDPGFGFGKTAAHNFQLLRELSFFTATACPILVGISRKGTIYKTLGVTAEEALNGTTVMHTIALLNGANILRVHDVKEAKEAIRLVSVYKEKEQQRLLSSLI